MSPHLYWLTLWLLHTALLTIPGWGKLQIWIIIFNVAMMPHRGWPPIWLPNTSLDTISHQVWLPIWRPNLAGCLQLFPNRTLTPLLLLPSPDSLILKNYNTLILITFTSI